MDNATFLRTVFAGRSIGEYIWVCSFLDDPGTTNAWKGFSYNRIQKTSIKNNNFFCISTMREVDNVVRRRIAHYAGTYCIVLDDIGTKVEHSKVNMNASWVLETSPGNYQVGYILRPVVKDAEQVLRLQLALVQQGLAVSNDPGMVNVTRYMRLPEGRNTKAKYGLDGWTHRLDSWVPARTYSLADIVDGYSLDLSQVDARGGRTGPDVVIDVMHPDPYLLLLQHVGLLYGCARGAIHNMICPWIDEHTDKDPSGTAYFSPCGFKCYHGHCQARTFHDLKLWLHAQGNNISQCESILRGYKLESARQYLPVRRVVSTI